MLLFKHIISLSMQVKFIKLSESKHFVWFTHLIGLLYFPMSYQLQTAEIQRPNEELILMWEQEREVCGAGIQ